MEYTFRLKTMNTNGVNMDDLLPPEGRSLPKEQKLHGSMALEGFNSFNQHYIIQYNKPNFWWKPTINESVNPFTSASLPRQV